MKKYLIEILYQYVFGALFIAMIVGYPQLKDNHPEMDTQAYMWTLGILMTIWVTLILNFVKAAYLSRETPPDETDETLVILEVSYRRALSDKRYEEAGVIGRSITSHNFHKSMEVLCESQYHKYGHDDFIRQVTNYIEDYGDYQEHLVSQAEEMDYEG